MAHYDVIIIGGGPAGSTVGTLIKRYSPHLRVLLLEKETFPRHHVGESLLPGSTPVLCEMGAYDKVKNYDFVSKLGASYIWGRDRKPWGFEFRSLQPSVDSPRMKLPEQYATGWHVRRSEYDHLLLQTAAEWDVEVRTGVKVHTIRVDQVTGRVVGVEIHDRQGVQSEDSTWLLDCSGQDSLLSKTFRLRAYDDRMNNYALWGYWLGGKWKSEYLGHPDLARIFIATTPRGWIWYIPVKDDVASVGFVTHRQILSEHRQSTNQLYFEEIQACPEMSDLLEGAELVHISADQRRDICAIRDWSYDSRQIAGPGWALVGDAAGFVDPILSSGVMLAHELGQKAAYTVNSSFANADDQQIGKYWEFYETSYRTYLHAYRDMAAFWYGNNFSMESWWWQARRGVAHSEKSPQLSDMEAFMRVASGYANRTESVSLFGSYQLYEARRVADGLFGEPPARRQIAQNNANRQLRLRPQAKLINGFCYHGGSVQSGRRIVNEGTGDFLDLHDGEDLLVEALSGDNTVEDLDRVVSGLRSVNAWSAQRTTTELVAQLDGIGVLV